MAFFVRPRQLHYAAPEPNFAGLFRLIEDFNRQSVQQAGSQCPRHDQQVRTFTPKFDLRETETAFELYGELPGVERENVHIEFTDPQTLLVRGKVDRTYTSGTPPAGLVENKSDETSDDHSEVGDDAVVIDHESDTGSVKSHKATVEDDPEESRASTTTETEAQNTPATATSHVAQPLEKPESQPEAKAASPQQKYFLVERSIGQFSRSFTFPGRVDSESVSASLDNGILSVTVQKAKKHESRRIAIY